MSKGLRLVARITRINEGYNKNEIFELLEDITPDTKEAKIKRILPREGEELTITHFENFGLGYALTVQSTQGLTLSENIAIHEVGAMLYHSTENFYTAISRCNKFEQLNVSFHNADNIENTAEIEEIPLNQLNGDNDDFNNNLTPHN